MSEELQNIIDGADLIVNGYTFTIKEKTIRVLNTHKLNSACVFSLSGEVLETSMDDIEIEIVKEYLKKNSKYLEDRIA